MRFHTLQKLVLILLLTVPALSYALTCSGPDTTISSNQSTYLVNTNTNNFTVEPGGSITGTLGQSGLDIITPGCIETLTNKGSILGLGLIGDILNDRTLGVFNNLQGKSSNRPLVIEHNLPSTYNIIINGNNNYGQIAFYQVSGQMAFGISSLSTAVAAGTYAKVLSGYDNGFGTVDSSFSLANLTNTSGRYGGYRWIIVPNGNYWDLVFSLAGPSAADTQASLHNSAQRLRSTFNASAISTNFANMNTYDCNLFDTKGMCISAGGRYTTVDNPSSNSSSAVVVVGYKASPNIRIGGFLDQNFNTTTPTGIHIANKNPMMGAFAVWNQNEDHLGYQVKIANAYQDKDVTTTRDVIGTSEAGRGKTELNTQSYVGELSYAFTFKDKTLVRPYLALRHTTIKQDAYTEDTTVTVPLTYAALEDKSTAALLGIKLNHALTPKVNLTASLGVEQDLNHKVDQYAASGVSGLTSENFNDNIKHTRPVASLGAYYAVSKTQRISGDVYYQQLPFQSTGSTTAYFNYTVGL